MDATDRKQFDVVLTTAMNVYDKRVDPAQAAMWFAVLGEFSIADIRRAFGEHMRDPDRGQFAPKPADLVRAIRGSTEARSIRAWDSLVEAIRRAGHTHDVVLPDPVLHAVVRDLGGWMAVCRWREDELPHRQRDFAVRYAAYRGRAPDDYPRVLLGRGDIRESPMLLGPPDACAAVMQGVPMLEAS